MHNRLSEYFDQIEEDQQAQKRALDAAIMRGLDEIRDEATIVLDIDGEDVSVTLDEACEWEAYEFDDLVGRDFIEDEPSNPLDEMLSEQRKTSERIVRESQRLSGMYVQEEDDGEGFLTT